ncbi:hypothetical protein BJ322DRAFT_1111866 [Thelephora terrestris]|uniref:Uncharacterized protein n=1 Tax=Thelephora terrestris TaxID=56493 RepID=A0A9P6L3H7_9AGAM|nr:hypothetical protein BJ322DRAFT_1111866 [Thelephora terrestris]
MSNAFNFSDNPFAALKVLKGASAITGAPGEGVFELFVVPVVNMLEMHPPAHARRLLACAAHPNMPLKHPEGGIVNVALQDPGNLSFNPTSGYLLSKDTGEACYFSSGGIKQICITPSAHGCHRFVAVLASVYGTTTLFFPTFQEGVSFATSQFSNSKGSRRRSKSTGGPIEGPELKDGVDIPTFDGREQFKLRAFWEKPYKEEVKVGSTVMVLFSVKRGGLGAKAKATRDLPKDVVFAMYFNILAVIVLKDPAEDFKTEASQEGPHAFGIENVAEEFGNASEVDEQKDDYCQGCRPAYCLWGARGLVDG